MTNPQKRLSKDSIKVWLIHESIGIMIGLVILGVLWFLDNYFSWAAWAGWILKGLTSIAVLAAIWSWMKPFLLYRSWRYDVDEEFLQLKSGVFIEKHKLVPMTKIQSVGTKHGPILRKYGLCLVSIQTMGSHHTIPALPKETAAQLRNQIAHYAKIKEVES